MYNINDYVKVKNSNITGKVIRKNNTNYLVLSGTNKIYISENMLEKTIEIPANNSNVNFNLQRYNDSETHEIMLRHLTKEEAILNLDKFIDIAICNKQHRIKIIHGKNGGILRKAVHEYLKNSPNVKSFSLGEYHEGSYGVTIAYLK